MDVVVNGCGVEAAQGMWWVRNTGLLGECWRGFWWVGSLVGPSSWTSIIKPPKDETLYWGLRVIAHGHFYIARPCGTRFRPSFRTLSTAMNFVRKMTRFSRKMTRFFWISTALLGVEPFSLNQLQSRRGRANGYTNLARSGFQLIWSFFFKKFRKKHPKIWIVGFFC